MRHNWLLNIIENIKKEIKIILSSTNKIGINIEKEENNLNSIIKKYEETLWAKSLEKEYYNDIHKLLSRIRNKYQYFLNIYEDLQECVTNINSRIEVELIESNVIKIIYRLESLKEKEIYQNENFTKYLYNIYKISYELMLQEFLCYKSSKLYEYFTSNEHDFWYINIFIKTDIEELEQSINYVFGLNELEERINKRENTNHFVDEDIIKALSVCENPEYYQKICERDLHFFLRKFSSIFQTITTSKKIKKTKLKKEFLNLLKEYNEFLKDKGFLHKYNEEEIVNIKIMRIRIEKLF